VRSLESHKEKFVVDDEASIRRILKRGFHDGYDVVTADGEEALDTFRKADPTWF